MELKRVVPVVPPSTLRPQRGRVAGGGTPPLEPGDGNAATSIGPVACAERRYVVETYACTIDALRALAAALRAVKGGMFLCPKVYPRSLA